MDDVTGDNSILNASSSSSGAVSTKDSALGHTFRGDDGSERNAKRRRRETPKDSAHSDAVAAKYAVDLKLIASTPALMSKCRDASLRTRARPHPVLTLRDAAYRRGRGGRRGGVDAGDAAGAAAIAALGDVLGSSLTTKTHSSRVQGTAAVKRGRDVADSPDAESTSGGSSDGSDSNSGGESDRRMPGVHTRGRAAAAAASRRSRR